MLKRLLIITLFSCGLGFLNASFAQINDESPYPADFVINSPGTISGIYDYGNQVSNEGEWGPRLSETLTADIAWGYGASGDSLGCEPITTDLTGKFALIRRGGCGFSLKAYNAQEAGAVGAIIVNHYDDPAQDGNTLVGMIGGDSINAVEIPAIFVSRITGEAITSELDNGSTVNASFKVKFFYDPVTSYSYHTPYSQALAVDVFQVNLINGDTTNSVNAEVTMEITDPNGATTTFTATSDIAPASDSVVVFTDTYTPSGGEGTYEVKLTNNLNTEEINTAFVMTEDTWAVDNGSFTGAVGPSDDAFVNEYSLRYNTANLVFTGDDAVIAPFVAFGIGNADALNATGDDTEFAIRLYDADSDGDNVLDLEATFEDLVSNTIAGVDYQMNGSEVNNELIVVELESLVGSVVELQPNHPYYVAIEYDGTQNGNGIAPRFTRTESVPYLNFPTTPLELDQLYTGWAGSTVVTRLLTDQFVDAKEVESLDAEKVSVYPNPASSVVNLELSLDKTADLVEVGILNMEGQIVRIEQFEGVQAGVFPIDVSKLGTGIYFLSIKTPEGWRSKKIQVVH